MIRTIIILAILLSAPPALAHSFYSGQCCADKDCRPVPCDEIRRVDDGWFYQQIHFDRVVLKSSPDGGCHICVNSSGMSPFGTCIYLPPEG